MQIKITETKEKYAKQAAQNYYINKQLEKVIYIYIHIYLFVVCICVYVCVCVCLWHAKWSAKANKPLGKQALINGYFNCAAPKF